MAPRLALPHHLPKRGHAACKARRLLKFLKCYIRL